MDNFMNVMENKAEIILLSADALKSEGGQGGANISGMSVFYIFNTTMSPVYNSPTSYGQKPGKIWMDYDKVEKIIAAPARYVGTFGMKVGSDGKPVLVLKDLDYINDVILINQDDVVKQSQPSLEDLQDGGLPASNESNKGAKK